MARCDSVDRKRRALLKAAIGAAGAFGGCWLAPGTARAERPAQAFAAKTADQALRELFGELPIQTSDRIHITLPALAEDGAVVPLTVETDLPAVASISVVSGKNPVPLIARFDFGATADGGFLETRIKLAESQQVTVVVKSDGVLYSAQKAIEVIIGGCA